MVASWKQRNFTLSFITFISQMCKSFQKHRSVGVVNLILNADGLIVARHGSASVESASRCNYAVCSTQHIRRWNASRHAAWLRRLPLCQRRTLWRRMEAQRQKWKGVYTYYSLSNWHRCYCTRKWRQYCFQHRHKFLNTITHEPLHLARWNFA